MMNNRYKRSFTLIEMLIVIVIIGILAAALVPRLTSLQSRARNSQRRVDVSQLSTALRIHAFDYGAYPPNLNYLTSSGIITSLPQDPQTATNEPCRSPYHNTWSGYRQSSGYYLYLGQFLNMLGQKGYVYVITSDKRSLIGARMEDDGSVNSFNIANVCSWIGNSWSSAPQVSAMDTVATEINSGPTYKGRIFAEILSQ